ncbi:hypothetical protein GCM10027418_06950 [Mariniluteicoccus endophyticus]
MPATSSTPSSGPTVTGAPSKSQSATTAELSTEEFTRRAQGAYQTAFDEFERMAWAGGAAEPSPKLLEVAEGKYVEKYMSVLRQQKTDGAQLKGTSSTTRSKFLERPVGRPRHSVRTVCESSVSI